MTTQLSPMSRARPANHLAAADGTGDWRDRAACRDDDPTEWDRSTDYARGVCDTTCAVRDVCLEFALTKEAGPANMRAGMYGGANPERRARLNRAARRKAAQEAAAQPPEPEPTPARVDPRPTPADCAKPTANGARRHMYAGQLPCTACAAALEVKRAEWSANRRARRAQEVSA